MIVEADIQTKAKYMHFLQLDSRWHDEKGV
jgi:hypothetical protein